MLSVVSAVLLRRFILLEKYLDFEISLFGRSNLVYRIGLSLINFPVVLKEFQGFSSDFTLKFIILLEVRSAFLFLLIK